MRDIVVTIERNKRRTARAVPRRRDNRTLPSGYRASSERVVAGRIGTRVVVPDDAALVVGGAACVWRDLAVLETMIGGPWAAQVFAINDLGCQWPRRMDHWITLHPEKLPSTGGRDGWIRIRESRGYPNGYQIASIDSKRRYGPRMDYVVDQWGSGSSGLLAVAAAYQFGCSRVVLCGVPMDDRPHFTESVVHDPALRWTSVRSHRAIWETNLRRLRERTRSLSGWTRRVLGGVTLEWLCPQEEIAS